MTETYIIPPLNLEAFTKPLYWTAAWAPGRNYMNKALIREWMGDCADCLRLTIALNAAEGGPLLVRLKAFEEVRSHLVDEHPVMLPGYFEDCANCQEWKATQRPEDVSVREMVLGREALLHRAGHLLYDQPPRVP